MFSGLGIEPHVYGKLSVTKHWHTHRALSACSSWSKKYSVEGLNKFKMLKFFTSNGLFRLKNKLRMMILDVDVLEMLCDVYTGIHQWNPVWFEPVYVNNAGYNNGDFLH